MHMWYYYVVKKVGCRYSVYNYTGDLLTVTQIFAESSDCCFDQYIL